LILQKVIAFPIDRGVVGVLSKVLGWKESELLKEVQVNNLSNTYLL
jgi:hypothetical protein